VYLARETTAEDHQRLMISEMDEDEETKEGVCH
jgi:hypothetical protein